MHTKNAARIGNFKWSRKWFLLINDTHVDGGNCFLPFFKDSYIIVKPTIVAITAALPRISKIRTRNDRFTLDGGVGLRLARGMAIGAMVGLLWAGLLIWRH